MSKEKLVPKLRFQEFESKDIWSTSLLGEVLSLLKDGTHGTHPNTESNYFLLSAKNIKNNQVYIDVEEDRTISKQEFNKIHRNFNLQKNDVLLTVVGSIGESAILKDPSKITFQRSVAYLRPNEKLRPYFLLSMINTKKFQKELKKRQVVSAQPGIYLNKLNIINIAYPDIKEQDKIGSFFKKIDQMIQLQQAKVNKVKNIKSAYLSEIFPKEGEKYPKKRFEEFQGSWEISHLGQITGINKGEQLNKESMIKNGRYYVLNGGINPSGYTNVYNTKKQTISISEGGNSCGYVNYNEENFWSGGHNYALTNPKINVLYLYYFLKSRQEKIMSLRVGSGLPNIQITALSEFDILYPLRDEQIRIGKFFKNLDNQILIEERKLEKLEKFKKAYLNDMFV